MQFNKKDIKFKIVQNYSNLRVRLSVIDLNNVDFLYNSQSNKYSNVHFKSEIC